MSVFRGFRLHFLKTLYNQVIIIFYIKHFLYDTRSLRSVNTKSDELYGKNPATNDYIFHFSLKYIFLI